MTSSFLKLIATVSLAVALAAPALAADEHDHGKAGHEHGEKEHADKSHFKAKVPADLKEAWSQITNGIASAEADLAAAKLEAVHEFGEQLEASIHYLHENSGMVTGEAQTRLASALKQLDKSADTIHHAAEDKDAAKIGQEIKKAKGLLPLIEAQYPAGTIK